MNEIIVDRIEQLIKQAYMVSDALSLVLMESFMLLMAAVRIIRSERIFVVLQEKKQRNI